MPLIVPGLMADCRDGTGRLAAGMDRSAMSDSWNFDGVAIPAWFSQAIDWESFTQPLASKTFGHDLRGPGIWFDQVKISFLKIIRMFKKTIEATTIFQVSCPLR